MRIIYLITFLALGLLCAPASIRSIILFLCVGVAAYHVWIRFISTGKQYYINQRLIFPDIIVAVLLVIDFTRRWELSSKAAMAAQMIHIPTAILLYGAAVILGIFAFFAIDDLIWGLDTLVKSEQSYGIYFALLLVSLLEYLSIEVSSGIFASYVLYGNVLINIANICIIILLNLLILWLVQKSEIAMGVTSLLFFFWSVVNYYTIRFHGSPLFPNELVNTKTALGVVFNYNYTVSLNVLCIIFYFLLELCVIIAACGVVKDSIGKRIRVRLMTTFLIVGTTMLLYPKVMGIYQEWMPWEIKIRECGFIICSIKNLTNWLNPYIMPEGYQVAAIQNTVYEKEPIISDNPDIIFILNETFCDLDYYTDLAADSDYMADFYSLTNAIYGHAIVPNVGGGTNDSEFELLMSKSMYLLGSGAPFTYIKEEVAGRSIVTVLESQGYTTMAMHCENGANYNRENAYPALGFDHVLLGPESFTYSGSYGNRVWFDSDNYRDLVNQYNALGEEPRFMYLLTMQNHGGYEQNDSSYDTVHTQNDFDSITDDVDEFLTSICLSAKAFRELTDYFKESDRNIIICMVGDHAPAFIDELPEKEEMKVSDSSINMRTVPYVIWANFDMNTEMYTEYASLVDLAPITLKAAGMPLSPFYDTILQLHEMLPVRTSDGRYMDKEYQAAFYEYGKNGTLNNLLTRYYYMEYNSLLDDEEYVEQMFTIN